MFDKYNLMVKIDSALTWNKMDDSTRQLLTDIHNSFDTINLSSKEITEKISKLPSLRKESYLLISYVVILTLEMATGEKKI